MFCCFLNSPTFWRCLLTRRRMVSPEKRTLQKLQLVARLSSATSLPEALTIRNVGVIAHIDAGKTTTTERMLYYSGSIQHMGEVHDGDTVTDYLPQERERGITITSAAISFPWKKHKINLLDTPGHVDFTVEVERCLSVADGCVVILDASAGVEVQTLTVWKQANRANLPRVVYLNKMDKSKANVEMCLNSISKLGTKPLMIHYPLYENSRFTGVVDILRLQKYLWDSSDGRSYLAFPLDEAKDEDIYQRVCSLRENLIGFLSDHDEQLSELVLSSEDLSSIPHERLVNALRKATLDNVVVPVLAGSSYKNVGVQLLMDAVLHYLPSPAEVPNKLASLYGENVCAYVFKIVYNKMLGPLTFVRLYSGRLKPAMKIYNINRERYEKVGKVYIPFADEYQETTEIAPGNIAALPGLEFSYTGDTLTTSAQVVERVVNELSRVSDVSSNENQPVLAGIEHPEPVFFCSIEAPSPSKEKLLEKALENLQREDPSFKVTINPDSGQTVISGMGHLHIEIIKDRILKEYKVEAYLGSVRVSYRESVEDVVEETLHMDKTLGGTRNLITIGIRVVPVEGKGTPKNIKIAHTKDPDSDLNKLRPDRLKAVEHGMRQALAHGPILGFPVIDVELLLTELKISYSSSNTMVAAAASQCVFNALKRGTAFLLEPVMTVDVSCPDRYSKLLLNSLSLKGSVIEKMVTEDDYCNVVALTRLSELGDYASELRTFTSGTGILTMQRSCYQKLTDAEKRKAIQVYSGF